MCNASGGRTFIHPWGERGEEKIENSDLSKTTLYHVQLPRRIHNSMLMRSLVSTWARSRYGHHFTIFSCEYDWTSVRYRLSYHVTTVLYVLICVYFHVGIEHLVAD